jgi:hypothetical protein
MIKVGDKVRSFDFVYDRDLDGEQACYVEGTVKEIYNASQQEAHGFLSLDRRYRILVERDVWGGIEGSSRVGITVNPPVNGRPKFFGAGVTDFVELV